ncbi:uncharacterized protein [Parasteatoda tepidariorum]|uniref:uncharacterized protein n=1 Tax=Parasteatoda tepidariorum TaxID=114398 RepID=UPI0039BD62E8
MKRIHNSNFAKEMIFVDSTSGCEGLSSTMTILLAATKIGALPISVLIHSGQTMENYINAFALLKKNFPLCFGGNDHPEIVMTDDSSAERGALKKVWETSNRLLCHFHFAQADWRWLFTHNIPKDERPRLMRLFQAVMYAASEQELSEATSNILKERSKFPDFIKRFEKFYERRDEWVLLFREDKLTRQHNTNNYAEVSIRIIKDSALSNQSF